MHGAEGHCVRAVRLKSVQLSKFWCEVGEDFLFSSCGFAF
jgi:hypothetical protein